MNSRIIWSLTVASLLAACGGGGGGGGPAGPQLSALSVGPTSAYTGSHPGTLSLSGSVQVSGSDANGVRITLVNASGATVSQSLGPISGTPGQGILSFSATTDISALPAGQYEIDVQATSASGDASNVATQAFHLIAYPWQAATPMPRAVSEFAIGAVGTKVYVLGGVATQDGVGTPVADVQVYDTASGQWSSGPPLASARASATASVVGASLYLVGGYDATHPAGLSEVDVLDTQAGAWRSGPAAPTARFRACSAAIGSTVYVVDGTQSSTDSAALATLESLDTTTGTWHALQSAGYLAASPACAVLNGSLFVTGGDTSLSYSETIASQSYDPALNTWATTDFFSTNRSRHASVVVGGDVFIIGGYSDAIDGEGPTSSTQAYTPASNSWSLRADMPAAAQDVGAVVVGSKAYVFTPLTSYVYDAQSDLP